MASLTVREWMLISPTRLLARGTFVGRECLIAVRPGNFPGIRGYGAALTFWLLFLQLLFGNLSFSGARGSVRYDGGNKASGCWCVVIFMRVYLFLVIGASRCIMYSDISWKKIYSWQRWLILVIIYSGILLKIENYQSSMKNWFVKNSSFQPALGEIIHGYIKVVILVYSQTQIVTSNLARASNSSDHFLKL